MLGLEHSSHYHNKNNLYLQFLNVSVFLSVSMHYIYITGVSRVCAVRGSPHVCRPIHTDYNILHTATLS